MSCSWPPRKVALLLGDVSSCDCKNFNNVHSCQDILCFTWNSSAYCWEVFIGSSYCSTFFHIKTVHCFSILHTCSTITGEKAVPVCHGTLRMKRHINEAMPWWQMMSIMNVLKAMTQIWPQPGFEIPLNVLWYLFSLLRCAWSLNWQLTTPDIIQLSILVASHFNNGHPSMSISVAAQFNNGHHSMRENHFMLYFLQLVFSNFQSLLQLLMCPLHFL